MANKSLRTTEDILMLIANDEWRMHILRLARELKLSDWWIGAGFVRGKVWDALHDYSQRTPLSDVDLVYFDSANPEESTEKEYERQLTAKDSSIPWSVKNQARMHTYHNVPPFKDTTDALSRWVETPTCVAVTLDENDQLHVATPIGIDDLVQLRVRLNPRFLGSVETYHERMAQKQWQQLWPKLTILDL